MVLSHANVPDRNAQTKHLLELELYSALHISNLLGEILTVGHGGGELSGLGQTGAEETWNLLDQLLGCDEGVIFAGELLDQLFVLVELLEVVDGHGFERMMLGAVDVMLVAENADGHVRPWDLRELHGSGETLITLGIVVLETDLELDGLEKVAFFFIVGVVQQLLNITTDSGDCNF
jgi:hypothetical protein